MKIVYFKTLNLTLEELKNQYRKLAKKLHPDVGGTEDEFKILNNEYEYLQKQILNDSDFSPAEKKTEEELSEIYRAVIDTIVSIPGIVIELIGSWIWISGNTYPVRYEISKAGFTFQKQKKMWYWQPGDKTRRRGGDTDIDDIRAKYGTKPLNPKDRGGRYISGTKKKDLVKLFKRLQIAVLNKNRIQGIGYIGKNDVIF